MRRGNAALPPRLAALIDPGEHKRMTYPHIVAVGDERVCPNNGVTGLDTPAEVGGKDQQ
jgi:hypothetical protein